MNNDDNSDSDVAAPAIDSDGFDSMSKALIPAQAINLVMTLIPSMPNSSLNTRVESGKNECGATIDDLSSFVGTHVKYDMVNYHITVSHDAKENNSTSLT